MRVFAGIDVGSGYTKAVVLDAQGNVAGHGLTHSGADFAAAADRAIDEALAEAGKTRGDLAGTVSTGYGRTNVAFATGRRTEIDCHARGAYHDFPRAITVVDIGGQDNKVIQLDERGKRQGFTMNRKCAAGTGSFLEEIAYWLKIPLQEFSALAAQSTDQTVSIGSYCTVFAKTEILAKVREGVAPPDLTRAALESVAKRVLEAQVITGDVVLTGGVIAHVPIMKDILSGVLDTPVFAPSRPQHSGALGAALVAREQNP